MPSNYGTPTLPYGGGSQVTTPSGSQGLVGGIGPVGTQFEPREGITNFANNDLVFFNKEGDYLNINFNNELERYEGDFLFHENSSDTYKTFGVYMMEKIPSFEFELPGELTTRKFQLFNEFGLHLYAAKYNNQQIDKIEPVNNDPEFYSKWIFGENFEAKFPIGSLIKFDSDLLEFNDLNRTYVVVRSKKNAIMILSQMDNDTFESTYFNDYTNTNTYINKKISGINAFGVYDYVDEDLDNNLSSWNEPDFYDYYYIGKKLNIITSNKNDSVVTVNNNLLTDQPHFEYFVSQVDLPVNENIIIEVITRSDLPKTYEGPLTINNNSEIIVNNPFLYPQILKPGREFKIVGSPNNTIFFTVASIPNWNAIVNETFFATQSQVIFNNKIYECVQAYTQSFSNTNTSFITPVNTDFWNTPTVIRVEQPTIIESLLQAQIYLTTDKYYFEYGWTGSSAMTLASAAEKYKSDLELFNIDIFFKNSKLQTDLIYPSEYAIVNFYYGDVLSSNQIGDSKQTVERLVGLREEVNYELNYNISENFRFNIVLTDIDSFGLKIIINEMIYDEEIAFVFSGGQIDMERTIDRTLRNWLTRNYLTLYTLGINANLQFTGSFTSPFYNSIVFTTHYPNVPMLLNDVLVGSTADYYIEHSRVVFNELGGFLNIKINDVDYGIETVPSSSTQSSLVNIPQTLSNWIGEFSEELERFGILVININNLLKFDLKRTDRRFQYSINTGNLDIPGLNNFVITRLLKGNHGMLVTSNEVLLPTSTTTSFIDAGFSTGMVFSINNTVWTWNNQEYNIIYLDDDLLNLSYQGPFWGLTDSICNSSAYTTIAFNLGFGQTGCQAPIIPSPYNQLAFSPTAFSLTPNVNTYIPNTLNLTTFTGSTNLIDIIYVQLSSYLYALGDGLLLIDAYSGIYVDTIELPGNIQSIELEYNTFNNKIYCLTETSIYVIDPTINQLVGTINLTIGETPFDMSVNPVNGDVYVSYSNQAKIDIWSENNFSNPSYTIDSNDTLFPLAVTQTGKMVFNQFQEDMYINTDDDLVLRVNTTRDIQDTYTITGLNIENIFYEPANENIYVYGTSGLFKIDGLSTTSISGILNQPFVDMLFNNLTGEMNISDSSNLLTRLNINTDTFQQNIIAANGFLELNQFDGNLYISNLSTSPSVLVIDPTTGLTLYNEIVSSTPGRLVYNPERRSIWILLPGDNSLVEIEVELNSTINIISLTFSNTEDNLFGTLDSNYENRPSIWLKTRDYIRQPRENLEGDVSVQYYWKWQTDEFPEMFMYDFSGDQLPNDAPYGYIGARPLPEIVLNKKPNRNLELISKSEHQQTIFDKIEYELSYINDSEDFSTDVTPLQLFLGYKQENEGALQSNLQLFKKESIRFSIDSNQNNNIFLSTEINSSKVGIIRLSDMSNEFFTTRGLKPNQIIAIYLKDITNNKNQYISDNSASLFKIREVYTRELIVDFLSENDELLEEQTSVQNYPNVGSTTYLRFTIEVQDKEIGRFKVFGQTEEEDERFKIELGNVGKLIDPDDVFIFKSYDILEGGIDWIYLNNKRKEMLMMKHLIYPYIGAYKSIINAINYFGYNDLQLNEYYRNVNQESENFSKLFKVEIPTLFDNSIEGWEENDFILNTFPNNNYEETKMFNLTYFVTNKQGDNILDYTLDEVIIKLQGLKYWLKRNIIPLTHKILDITGQFYVNSGNYIKHKTFDVKIYTIKEEMTPITFKLSEAYLMPINTGSAVYNCVLDFYSIIPNIGAEPSEFLEKTKAFNGSSLKLPDSYNIKIRSYKTYKEWAPFSIYNIGDRIIYFDKLYESSINNNRSKNPRKYETVLTWKPNIEYTVTTVVEYKREFYVFSGLGLSSSVSPNLDQGPNNNWRNITEWELIDYEPIQTINEWRKGSDLLPFNFTIDSNLDPFVTIDVVSDNGYGATWGDRKNYEIRGTRDLQDTSGVGDKIGPFQPIQPILIPIS